MLDFVNSFAIKWEGSGENVIHSYLSPKSDNYAKMLGTQGLFFTKSHGRGCVNTTVTFWAVSPVSLKQCIVRTTVFQSMLVGAHEDS